MAIIDTRNNGNSNNKLHKFILTLSSAFFMFSLYAYIPELSTYANDLGASFKMVGLITGSYGLTQLICRIPLGILSDRIDKRKIFVSLGFMVSIISSLITFIHPTAYSLLATRLLAGVAVSTWVTFIVLYSSYYKKEEATKSIGIMNSFNNLGQLAAMLMSGFISFTFGTRYLYLLGAIGGIIGFIISLSIYEEKGIERKKTSIKEFLVVVKDHQLLLVSVLAIISQIITYATAFGFVPILARGLGADNVELSLLAVIGVFPGIFMSTFAGAVLARKWGSYRTIGIGFFISSLLCVLMPLIPNLWQLFIAQFLSGIGRSMVLPLLMGLGIAHIDHHKRATAMGFFQAVYGIGMVLGPIILGSIAERYSLTAGFAVTGIIGSVAIIIVMIKSRTHDKNSI